MSLYGLVKPQHALDMANAVCDALGHGKNCVAVEQVMETLAAETGMATVADRHVRKLGVGIGQTDRGTFNWLQDKYQEGRFAEIIERNFGVKLIEVLYEELAFNALLSIIFVRLRYKPYPVEIPASREGRAKYWKDLYNSSRGKGSESHYLTMCECTLDKMVELGEIR